MWADNLPYMSIHMDSLRDEGTDISCVRVYNSTKVYTVDNSFRGKSSFLTIQGL